MKQKTRKVLSLVLVVVFMTLMLTMNVFAAEDFQTGLTKIANNIKGVATVFIIFCALATAILYMASALNPSLKNKAKDALFGLIIGIIIFALSTQIAGWVVSITGGDINKKVDPNQLNQTIQGPTQ